MAITQKLLLSVDTMDAYMTLFGFNDQNVALIEQECSVTISLRGAELHISGEEKDVLLAQSVIEKLCDIDSLVDNYILQELSHNRYVGFASFFFYRKDGVFHFGPPWDFDLALGNDREYPNALNEILSEGSRGNAWFSALYEQKWFKNLVKARMAEIDPLIRTMTGELEMMGKALEEGAARTYKAFPVLGHHIFLEPSITAAYKTYPPHVDYLVSWIEQRWTFLRKTIR